MVAIPAIGAAILAIFALLFILCWPKAVQVIATMLQVNLPIIGNVIASAVIGAGNLAYDEAQYFLDNVIDPAWRALFQPVYAVENMFTSLQNGLSATYSSIYTIAHALIPTALAQAQQYTNDIGGEINNWWSAAVTAEHVYATDVLATSHDFTNQVGAYVITVAQGLVDSEHTFAVDVLATSHDFTNQVGAYVLAQAQAFANIATATALGLAGQANTLIQDVALQAAADTIGALATAEQYATQAATTIAGGLITDVEKSIVAAENAIYTDVQTGTAAVLGVIGTDLPDIAAGLRALPIGDILTITGAATIPLALSIPILKYMEQCGIPNCKNLSQFGRDLQALLGLVEDAGFLFFVDQLIKDPSGAAQTATDVFIPIFDDAIDSAKSLLGIS